MTQVLQAREVFTKEEVQIANKMIQAGWRATGNEDNFSTPLVANVCYPDAGEMTYHEPLFLADAGIEPWDGIDWTVDNAAQARIQIAIHVLDLIVEGTEEAGQQAFIYYDDVTARENEYAQFEGSEK